MFATRVTKASLLAFGGLLSVFAISCKDYEYSSPLPGILEVRLKTVNNYQEFIPFGPQNEFSLLLKDLNAALPGSAVKQPILPDLYAIRRDNDGYLFNVLDPLARDSSFILGQTYAPPLTYSGIDLAQVEFPRLFVLFYRERLVINSRGDTVLTLVTDTIRVTVLPPPAPPLETFYHAPGTIQVNEGRVTVVTVAFDLDRVFIRRSESFEFHPSFYISSVINH